MLHRTRSHLLRSQRSQARCHLSCNPGHAVWHRSIKVFLLAIISRQPCRITQPAQPLLGQRLVEMPCIWAIMVRQLRSFALQGFCASICLSNISAERDRPVVLLGADLDHLENHCSCLKRVSYHCALPSLVPCGSLLRRTPRQAPPLVHQSSVLQPHYIQAPGFPNSWTLEQLACNGLTALQRKFKQCPLLLCRIMQNLCESSRLTTSLGVPASTRPLQPAIRWSRCCHHSQTETPHLHCRSPLRRYMNCLWTRLGEQDGNTPTSNRKPKQHPGIQGSSQASGCGRSSPSGPGKCEIAEGPRFYKVPTGLALLLLRWLHRRGNREVFA